MNVYEIITARIVKSLEEGVVPWRCPWTSSAPKSLVSGHDYRGVNVLLLQSCGFASPYWLTYKQCQRPRRDREAGRERLPGHLLEASIAATTRAKRTQCRTGASCCGTTRSSILPRRRA